MANMTAIAATFQTLMERIVNQELDLTIEWATNFEIRTGNSRIPKGPYVLASLVYMFESLRELPDEIGTILCNLVGPCNDEEAIRVFDEYLFNPPLIYKLIEIWTHKNAVPRVFNISMMNSIFFLSHQAAARDNLDTLKWLLENGVEIENRDFRGETLLHVAAEYGNFRIAEELVARGATFYTLDNAYETPFEKALYRENFEIADMMEPNILGNRMFGDGEILFFKLIRDEMESQLEYLLKYVNFSFVNLAQQNFLHVAISTGNVRIIGLLLSYFSDPDYVNALDLFDLSPLHIAVMGNHAAIVEVLLHYGALMTLAVRDQVLENNDSEVLHAIRIYAYLRMIQPNFDPSNHPDHDLLSSLL